MTDLAIKIQIEAIKTFTAQVTKTKAAAKAFVNSSKVESGREPLLNKNTVTKPFSFSGNIKK